MTAQVHNPSNVPPGLLVLAALLIGVTILGAVVGRGSGDAAIVEHSTALAASDLKFLDRADGGVDVYRDAVEKPVATLPPGTNGFIRATMRGLASERKREAKTDEMPFRLTAWADGRLTLDDPATGRRLDLEAFGGTNEAAFADLLPQPGARS